MTWFHRVMSRTEVNQDPIEGEFFAPEEGFAAALVREAIQNMLDGSSGGVPVRARFAFGELGGGENTVSSSAYLNELQPHLQAMGVPFRPQPADTVAFLIVEDFGTRGLCGDESQQDDVEIEPGEQKNDFYYFWRNIGRSQKETTDRGRWGLGKTVFPASSRTLAFFGVTRRKTDHRLLLMGQFVGKIHKYEGQKYAPYGYFGKIESDGFAMPIEDDSVLQAFQKAFGLNRGEEPGLSVVVPFPHTEIDSTSLLKEVVRNYYLPILFGSLIVEIEAAGSKLVVDDKSVGELAAQVGEGTPEMIDFAREAIRVESADRVELGAQSVGEAPKWESPALFQSVDLEALRAKFDSGALVSVRVPVAVKRGDTGQTKSSYFDVYIKRDPGLERGRAEFVRQGLTITRVDKAPRGSVRGLVLVSDAPLSGLLGDSEGPAHTKWEERRERVKRYQWGPSTVRFVCRSLQVLAERLSEQPESTDADALIDVFSLLEPDADEVHPRNLVPRIKGKKFTPPVIVPPIERKEKAYRVRKARGGFVLESNPNAQSQPDLITLRAAYEIEEGNAIKNYHPFDFDMQKSPISIKAAGCSFRASGNAIELVPEGATYSLAVSGFDTQRDIEVHIKP